tara:strand:- start:1003 stop:1161 length:159 start_codon:yes stop_codon:yes gene_type:complete
MDETVFLQLKTSELTLSKLKAWLTLLVGEEKTTRLFEQFHSESFQEVQKLQD